MARGNPKKARVGGYSQFVDSTGLDPEMKETMFGENPTALTKVEKDYVKGTKRASSMEAVRRARRANKKPPPKEY